MLPKANLDMKDTSVGPEPVPGLFEVKRFMSKEGRLCHAVTCQWELDVSKMSRSRPYTHKVRLLPDLAVNLVITHTPARRAGPGRWDIRYTADAVNFRDDFTFAAIDFHTSVPGSNSRFNERGSKTTIKQFDRDTVENGKYISWSRESGLQLDRHQHPRLVAKTHFSVRVLDPRFQPDVDIPPPVMLRRLADLHARLMLKIEPGVQVPTAPAILATDSEIEASDGSRRRIHRLLLALQSDYFRGLYNSKMRETEENVILFEDIPTEIVDLLVGFVYIDNYTPELTEMTAKRLMIIADRLGLARPLMAAEVWLGRALTLDNVVDTLVLAHKHNSHRLRKLAAVYATENQEVFDSAVWKRERASNPELVAFMHEVALGILAGKKEFTDYKDTSNFDELPSIATSFDDLRRTYPDCDPSEILAPDVTLVNGDERVSVHAFVFALQSPFIQDQLQKQAAGPGVSRPVVTLPVKVAPKILKLVLDFVYNDAGVPELGESARDVLPVAQLFGLGRLKAICERTAAVTLSVDNAFDTLSTAITCRAARLEEFVVRFVHEFCSENGTNPRMLDVIRQHPTVAMKFYEIVQGENRQLRQQLATTSPPKPTVSPAKISGVVTSVPRIAAADEDEDDAEVEFDDQADVYDDDDVDQEDDEDQANFSEEEEEDVQASDEDVDGDQQDGEEEEVSDGEDDEEEDYPDDDGGDGGEDSAPESDVQEVFVESDSEMDE